MGLMPSIYWSRFSDFIYVTASDKPAAPSFSSIDRRSIKRVEVKR